MRTGFRVVVALITSMLALGAVAAAESTPVLPETPLFSSFDIADGLPASKVLALAQDHEGHLWIGTLDGLARYDGVGFEVWRHDSADSASLPSNNVQALHVDARGRLWLAAEGAGISRLHGARARAFSHYNRSTDPRIEAVDVFAITSDSAGGIWFGGFRTGLYRLDPDSGDVQVFRHDPARADSLADDTVISLLRDSGGRIWVGTTRGVCRVDGPGFVCLQPPTDSVRGHWVWGVTEAADGGLLIGTADALWRLHDEHSAAARFERIDGVSASTVIALLDEGGGHWWVAQSGGLLRRQDDTWNLHPARPGQRWALPGQMVNAILRDHENGLWFATDSGGLARLPPSWRDFSVFRHEPERSAALPLGLAAAHDGGLWLVNQSATVERIDLRSGEVTPVFTISDLPGTKLRSVLQTRDGSLWLGHSDGLIIRAADGSERRFGPGTESPAPSGELDHLLETEAGIWVGVVGVALQLRSPDGDLLLDLHAGDGGLDSVETEHLAQAPDGALWWAGPGGLRRRAAESSVFEPVPGAPGERIFGFAFADATTLWLHRLGGLDRYHWDGVRLERMEGLGVRAGLPEVESGGVVIDGEGAVWLTTSRGLFRYRPPRANELASLRRFTERNGLPNSEFRNRQAPLLTRSGHIAALTFGGVVAFDPARLSETSTLSPLRWHSASVLRVGRRLDLDDGPIALRHDDRDLRFSLRLLSFADPSTHAYRFRLEGIDPDWIETGTTPERAYAQLPPGTYRLEVSAASGDGRWVPALSRDVHVAQPWWWTPWAWAGYAMASLLAVVLAFAAYRRRLAARYRLRMAEQAQALALDASETKGRFLATLGHEVRTPMTGLLGMNALLLASPLGAEQRRQAEAVRRAGQMMLRLVNEALDLARIEAGRLELLPQSVSLPRLVDEVVELERPLAEGKGLRLLASVSADAAMQIEADPLRLQQILLNLLGNAIKFTASGEVRLRISALTSAGDTTHPQFCFEVEDTGAGMTEQVLQRLFQPFMQADGARTAQQHGGSGLGLMISRQLAEAMGGELTARSTPGRGSCFRLLLTLPVLGPAQTENLADPDALEPPSMAGLPETVLLVEDHPDVAQALAGLMRAWGCNVVHSAHALEALAQIDQHLFEVAVLDIDLPGLDGFELAKLIRAGGRIPRLVALTARDDAACEALALEAGFDVFLRKPAPPEALRAALRAPRGAAGSD
ncbi:ATP-binding protein [Aquimonas sp.]|jgi:signal transduction histidine kinase/CheY-like chemotaxis protein/streptogramin lyase|uniref:hybrid sensor histidine kinase/response regulator n=1 Tax=Aquimonas sp. TaxID=1872588 RepID=UPI0037BEBED1